MSRLYLWFNPCALFYRTSAHGTAGAVGARLSLRPLFKEGQRDGRTSGASAPRGFQARFENAQGLMAGSRRLLCMGLFSIFLLNSHGSQAEPDPSGRRRKDGGRTRDRTLDLSRVKGTLSR